MVWYRIVDFFAGEPKLPDDEPARLPPYFPGTCVHNATRYLAWYSFDASSCVPPSFRTDSPSFFSRV